MGDMSTKNSDFYGSCHSDESMQETIVFSSRTNEGIELLSYDTSDLSVTEVLGDVDLCPSDVDLHDDIESCMQQQAITEGPQLDGVGTSDVGTSDVSCDDDSCCNCRR